MNSGRFFHGAIVSMLINNVKLAFFCKLAYNCKHANHPRTASTALAVKYYGYGNQAG